MDKKEPENNQKPFARRLGHDALHDLIHFDTKFFKTLPPLLFKPGLLTEKALNGSENQFVKPFALFVLLYFVFFIFKSRGLFIYSLDTYRDFGWTASWIDEKRLSLHLNAELLTERFNTAMHFEQKEYLIIMIPVFALVLQLLYIFKKRFYVEHLVFSLYFYSFFIVYLMVVPYLLIFLVYALSKIGVEVAILYSQAFLTGFVLLINWIYLFFAVKKVYRGNIALGLLKSGVLSITTFLLLAYVYRLALFFIVMHSISD